MRLITFLEAVNNDTLGGGAGVLVFIPNTGRILVQIRGEHPDDKDSGKYDMFGGTLEEGETSEECARREAKEEGGLEFPEGELEEVGTFSSTEGGDWDGEPYHVFLSIQNQEFPVKIDHDEVAKAGWVEPDVINDENATNRLVKVLQHEKLAGILHESLTEAQIDQGVGFWFHVPTGKTFLVDYNKDVSHIYMVLNNYQTFGFSRQEAKQLYRTDEIIGAVLPRGWVRISVDGSRTESYIDGGSRRNVERALKWVSTKIPTIRTVNVEIWQFDQDDPFSGSEKITRRTIDLSPGVHEKRIFAQHNNLIEAQEDDDGWWYHVTSLARMPSIASQGLDPRVSGQHFGGGYGGHSTGRTFFATDPESAEMWFSRVQETLEASSDNPYVQTAVILRVDTKYFAEQGVQPEIDTAGTREVADSQFVTVPVPPNEIEVWTPGDQWNPRGWHPAGTYHDQPNPMYGHNPYDYQELDSDYFDDDDEEQMDDWQASMTEAAYPYHGYNFPGDWYHGMASSSRAFIRRKGSHPSNIGIWLTNNENIAAQFAKQASRRMVDDVPVLVTAKTTAENPMVFDTYREYLEAWREFNDSEKMRRALMRQGHDSVLIAKSDTDFGGEPRMDLAVFKPSEIRAVEKQKMTESRLLEGKKDRYYQIFSSITDQLVGLGHKDVGTEVQKYIDKAIQTLVRDDRIMWALRIFKKMMLLELKKLASKNEDWPWPNGFERGLRKLNDVPVHNVPKYMTPAHGERGKETGLDKLGYVDSTWMPRGRGRTQERNAAIKKNAEIFAQNYDNLELFNYSSYSGLDALLNEIGHYIGVGEAHTDVEPNNPVVSYQFSNQSYDQAKRELARLTKPLERKYSAGDVATGQVFLEISPEWRWELLTRKCRKEAKALGHCGGISDPSIGESDRLLSLREIRTIGDTERKRSIAHLTFVIDTVTGELSQMRGQANTKPKVQYHEFIIPLLMDKRVTGFKLVQYKPEGNFHLSDLTPQQITAIVSDKPNLLASLEPEGKKAVMLKTGKRAPRRPSPAAAQARQAPQPQYPQATDAMQESESILDAVLAEPGQNPGIGAEKEKRITPEISMLVSPYGSYRFIYRKGGKIVSGLQVVSRDGKTATTSNVKTHPDFLRQGLAKELLGVARRKFMKVDHSEHLTDAGAQFAHGTG